MHLTNLRADLDLGIELGDLRASFFALAKIPGPTSTSVLGYYLAGRSSLQIVTVEYRWLNVFFFNVRSWIDIA